MKKKKTTLQKLHRWPGFIVALFLVILATSGIILNHRSLFSSIDVSRNLLPSDYAYTNWNNASLKGNIYLTNDSILVYGNIGVWLTDSTFQHYTPYNEGFPKGIDHRKINDLHYTTARHLYAATQYGLYTFNPATQKWQLLSTLENGERFVAVESKNDSIYALSRSLMYIGKDEGTLTKLEAITLAAPSNYKKEVSLFETFWQIHSGEIVGTLGKLLVDFLALITLVLSLTGIVYFLFPSIIKRRKKQQKSVKQLGHINRFSLKWHNKLGAATFLLLIVCYGTGMFLRPPLLIPIAGKMVQPLKHTQLDQPNPWHDKLRDVVYDSTFERFILSTSSGMYFLNPANFSTERCQVQPPVSVMGINCFREFHDGTYLVGSFSGLFLWNPMMPTVINFVSGSAYQPMSAGAPVGEVKVSGMLVDHEGYPFLIEYSQGIQPLHHEKRFPAMPAQLQQTRISLWNFALEFHTLRVFSALMGNWYMLLIPLVGLSSIMVLLSGYLYFRKRYKKKTK